MPAIDHKKLDTIVVGVLKLLRLSDPLEIPKTIDYRLTFLVTRTSIGMSDSGPVCTTS